MSTPEPQPDSSYPSSWRPKHLPPERDIDAEIDDVVRNMSDREFQLLIWRTRGQGRGR